MDLSRRLGGPTERRRRHRRVVFGAVVLLAVAGLLVFVIGDDSDGDGAFRELATASCVSFGERIQREFELTFPDGTPSQEAEAEYLSRAFADTMDELVAELRSHEGAGDAAAAIDGLAARIAELRSDPERFAAAAANPFRDDVAPRFDALDIPACGSEFLGPSS